MPSGGGSPDQVTTTSQVPAYLRPAYQQAATAAQNLFQGGAAIEPLQAQIAALDTQIANAQQSGGTGGAPLTWQQAMQLAGNNDQRAQVLMAQSQGAGGGAADISNLLAQRGDLQTQLAAAQAAGTPEFFPEDTFVQLSDPTLQALGRLETGGISPVGQAAEQQILSTLAGGQTNPFLQQSIDAASEGVLRNFQQALPQLESSIAFSGRAGSPAAARAIREEALDLQGELGNIATRLSAQSFADERGRQLQAAALAPNIDAFGRQATQDLLTAGGIREAQSREELQDAIARFNFDQNIQGQQLDQFINRLSALGGGQGVQTTTQPAAAGGGVLGGLSGGLSGAATGASIGSIVPGIGTGIGALVGGGIGLLGGL